MRSNVEIDQLVEAFLRFFPEPENVVVPPGYRDSGIAVVDAVFSMQANYASTRNVVANYARWAGVASTPGLAGPESAVDEHSIDELRQRIEGLDVDELVDDVFDNRTKQNGRLKAELVREAAQRLCDVGLKTRHDVALDTTDDRYADQRAAWASVKGLGKVTFEYFRLLCGAESSKPDVMVIGWLDSVLGRAPDTQEALDMVKMMSEKLSDHWGEPVSQRGVDHTIWRHQSGRGTVDAHEDW